MIILIIYCINQKERKSIQKECKGFFSSDVQNTSNSDANNTVQAIYGRSRYSYSICDILYGNFCCIKWKPSKSKNTRSLYYRNTYFNKGLEKFEGEIDITTIIRSLRKVEAIMNTVYDENQRLLEEFSKYHIIDCNTNDSSDLFSLVPIIKSLRHDSKDYEDNLQLK